jgi:DNA-binding winged helix-turn-helix (wHTH) protein
MRFDRFVFDSITGELWSEGGEKTVLRPQLATLLDLFLHRPGELVTRAEIQKSLWDDKLLDVDRGINFCIRQLRETLGDEAREPRFLETLPRQGYRFLVPVETVDLPPVHSGVAPVHAAPIQVDVRAMAPAPLRTPPGPTPQRPRRHWFAFATAVGALAALLALGLGRESVTTPPEARSEATEKAELAFERGNYQLQQGLIEQACESLQEAITYDPQDARAWAQLSIAHMQLALEDRGHFEPAASAVARARELDPESALVALREGDLLAMRDSDWHGALEAYLEARERDPHNVEIHQSLALVSLALGQWDEAVQHAD